MYSNLFLRFVNIVFFLTLPLSCPRLHRMIFTTKYVKVRLTKIQCFFVTYVMQDAIWTAFFHLLPPFHMEPGNVPYASRAEEMIRYH